MAKMKLDHYLALRNEGHDMPARVFDMLRYDACYPVSNAPDGWYVFKQPYREGITGGFTLARWSSFGFRSVLVEQAPVMYPGIPTDLIHRIRIVDEHRAARMANQG